MMGYDDNCSAKLRVRQKICLITALIFAALLTAVFMVQRGIMVEARAVSAQKKLSEEVLRFHVLADSDEPEDQELKLRVKNAVLSYMQKEIPDEADLEGTCTWVKTHMKDLEQTALEELKENGCTDTVRAELVKDYFPDKSYGDITFPAGEYRALRIRIGEAEGHNWWCCLYPSLCFTDAVTASVPDEEKVRLEHVLGEDEYDMITAFSNFKIKWFFLGGGSGETK